MFTIGLLQFQLDDKGGPSADANLFEQILELQDVILAQFGLPSTATNQNILYYQNYPTTEELFEKIHLLNSAAKEYALREPMSDMEKLKLAKLKQDSVFEILPELKIITHAFPIFIYENMYLKMNENEEEILEELNKCKNEVYFEVIHKKIYNENTLSKEENEFFKTLNLRYLDQFLTHEHTLIEQQEQDEITMHANFYNLSKSMERWEMELQKSMEYLNERMYAKPVENYIGNSDEYYYKHIKMFRKLSKKITKTKNELNIELLFVL